MQGEVTVHSCCIYIFSCEYYVHFITESNTLVCSIMNAVKASGGLRERLFNAAYNAKKQALLNGRNNIDKVCFSMGFSSI